MRTFLGHEMEGTIIKAPCGCPRCDNRAHKHVICDTSPVELIEAEGRNEVERFYMASGKWYWRLYTRGTVEPLGWHD